MASKMTSADWEYVRNLAREQGVTLKDANVKRSQTFGYALDCVLAAGERHMA